MCSENSPNNPSSNTTVHLAVYTSLGAHRWAWYYSMEYLYL